MWIKRIQEAIIESKTKNLNETIISSLTGVTSKNFPMRPSRSFSNILELTLTHSDKKLSRQHSLRRSMSTFEETSRSVHDRGNLVKRYSADYATRKKTEINPRNHHSETYVKPDFSTPKRRPSSLDLLSDTGVIGKMSIQFKNNHQNAMRHNVDHKLRDVCSQEYLSSRAWYMRDTFEISHPVEKKKSVLRNSVSNLSLMMPKRSETKTLLVSPEAENDSRPSSTLPRNHSRASRASVPQPESFDCTFHLVASTDSNCSLKGKKKTLKQRVLRQIAGIRHIRSSIPEWRMSADTLKCDNVKTVSIFDLLFMSNPYICSPKNILH